MQKEEGSTGAPAPAIPVPVDLILDALEQAVIVTDVTGAIVHWSAGAEQLYGWTASEVLGRLITDVTPTELSREAADQIMEALLRGESYRGRFVVQRRDGSRFSAMVVDRPIADAEGGLLGVVGISWDVTEELAAQDRSRKLRSDTLSVLSHELRTPLTAIVGYQELLEGGYAGPVTELQRQHLDRIRASAWHLLDIVEQMLALSRLGAGTEDLRLEPVNVGHLVREVGSLIAPAAAAKGLALNVAYSVDNVVIRADPAKLRQILLNLLANAVKFTAAGEVGLAVRLLPAHRIEFRVSDTGPGIVPEARELIFEPFTQLDGGRAVKREGVGLGLAVVQRLVALMNGTVDVESEPGSGSTFIVVLAADFVHP